MRTRTRTRKPVIAAATAALLVAGTAGAITATGATDDEVTTGTDGTPTAAMEQTMQMNREEERLARDLYDALAEHHDDALPFSRITDSEQRHFDAVGQLLDRYGVDDPSEGLDPGEYAFPELQELYDDWLARGLADLDDAYQVGIELEAADIDHLAAAIEESHLADVDRVYENLMNGSEHHLAAYQAAADGTLGDGGTGPHGSGPGDRPGRGPGQGGPGAGPGQQRMQQQDENGNGPGAGPRGQGRGHGPQADPDRVRAQDCPYVEEDSTD